MSLDTQIKELLESEDGVSEDELIEETVTDITDEDQDTTSTEETSDEIVAEGKDEEDDEEDKDDEEDLEEETIQLDEAGEQILAKLQDAHDFHKKRFPGVAKDFAAAIKAHKAGKLKAHLATADTAAAERIKDALAEDTVKEHVDALLNGEELSEEFRIKATTIFEAAVADGVKKELAQIEEQYNDMLNEAINTVQDEMVDKIDGYLNVVVEEWVKENQLALERGVKADLVEDFIDGLKKLFNEHYVDIPEDKANILDEQTEQLEAAQQQIDEATQKVAELQEEILGLKKIRQIEMIGEELTDSQFEKFVGLCEGVAFESDDDFVNKIKTIKENYFPVKSGVVKESVNMDTPPNLTDETHSSTMDAYVRALASPLTFKNK